MPSVDVLINIHTTYFSCLDMLVTSVQSLLTLEHLANGRAGGIPLFICINPCGSESTPAWQEPAEGATWAPPLVLKKVRSKRDASSPGISRQRGVSLVGAGWFFFCHQDKQVKGSWWQILRLLKSSSRDRTSSWTACLNQKHKLLGST